jgi:hypothetical protein
LVVVVATHARPDRPWEIGRPRLRPRRPLPTRRSNLAFLDQEHKLRIRFDQIAATVGKARSDAHSSDERLRKAGDVFAEEAPKMHQVAQDMASVKAPPELEDSYAAYVRYIKAYADVLPAMARHAHEGKEGLVLGDLYGFLDNTDRADFKSKLIQQLRLRDIWVPPWLRSLGTG